MGVDTGNDLVAGWRRTCPPEKVIEVITICVAMTLIGGLVAVTFLAQAIAPGVPPQDAAIAALIGVATLGAIVWGTSVVPPGGLVDAIRHVIRSPGLGGKE